MIDFDRKVAQKTFEDRLIEWMDAKISVVSP